MTFQDAISNMVNHENEEQSVRAIFESVEPLCKTDTDGDTTLYEWLESGEFHSSDTPESIAAEWDGLSE